MGGWYNPRFRRPARKGGRGRPPLQLEWDGCEICRRAYTYRHTRYVARWLSLYIRFPSSGPRGVGDAAPYGVVFDLSRPPTPPRAPIRPRGVKRVKSQKGLTPQPPSAAAPLCKGSDGGLLPFYPFYYRVRVQPPPCEDQRKGGRGHPPLHHASTLYVEQAAR